MTQAKSLPARPNLDYLKKLAKQRLASLRAADSKTRLSDAQLIVAREHGFASWRKLKSHIDSLSAAALFDAIKRGDEKAVDDLLRANSQLINLQTDGQTPLHVAAEFNQPKLIDLLLARGADAKIRYGQSAHTPLSWAVTVGAMPAAEALLRGGVKPDFFCAAGLGAIVEVRSFFDKKGELRANSSQTGSSRFAANGSRLPRPPHAPRELISDALYIAARNGRAEVVKLLLKHDPDLSFRAYMGGTPLHWAHFNGSREVIEMLTEAGADSTSRDDVFHCSPRAFGICVPASWGIAHLVQAHLKADPSLLNILDGRGTPLHEAARNNSREIIKLLLDAGADPTIVDGDGKTALDLAIEKVHTAAVELLRGVKTAVVEKGATKKHRAVRATRKSKGAKSS